MRRTLLAAGALALLLLACDGFRKGACRTIDTLENACTVLRYTTPDGTAHDVPVRARDLAVLGERVRTSRLSDAGSE